MIEWRSNYFRAEDVYHIWNARMSSGKYRVTVRVKDAGDFYVDLDKHEDAVKEARMLSMRVERECAAGVLQRARDEILGDLNLIRAGVNLLDKRQRKLWRKLKTAIPEIGEEGDET